VVCWLLLLLASEVIVIVQERDLAPRSISGVHVEDGTFQLVEEKSKSSQIWLMADIDYGVWQL